MKINSNIMAIMGNAKLGIANDKAAQAMQRLTTGLKINSAKDDAAGTAIATKLNAQVEGLKQANQNAMNAIALVQTAEGALNEVHAMLNRLKELTVQGENGTLTTDDQQKIQSEIDTLVDEIKATGRNTEYNKMAILENGEDIIFQIGANANQSMSINGADIKMSQITDIIDGLNFGDPDIGTKVEKAIAKTSAVRGVLGAAQNRLEHTVTNLGVSEENMTSALSRIQDADLAEEMTNYTQYNILSQSAIAMLAQANQRPQQVLQLLQ